MNNIQKTITIFTLISLLLLSSIIVQADENPPEITIVYPGDGQKINQKQPTITINYQDADGIDININTIQLIVDTIDVTFLEYTTITDTSITYTTPEVLALSDGNHTIQFFVLDKQGNKAELTWSFTIDTSISIELPIDFSTLIEYLIIGLLIFAIGFILYILYLKRTRKFTFKKFFAQHPIEKEVLTIYIPIILAFLFTIFSLLYISQTPNLSEFSIEYLVVIVIFIAIGPYALESQFERRLTTKYEKAYAQLLFEIADAMRGGLDPTKAIIELSKTDTSILHKRLKIAADNIRIGRPFHEIMPTMARNIKSDLVQRYATIIGETSRIGGDPAVVIHRAAKDMDDFIKINKERRRQLTTQATIVYIAVAVLLIVLYQLIVLFPSIGTIDLNLLNPSGLDQIQGSSISRMSIIEVKQRFFDLCLVNAVGTGTVIGAFIDGHFKYGLIHSLVLTAVAAIFFIALII